MAIIICVSAVCALVIAAGWIEVRINRMEEEERNRRL